MMTTAKTYLESLRAQLKAVMTDLSNMPRHKAGTDWHQDRVSEAWWLVAAIERQEKLQQE
jgi:hypothetical protein